MKHRTAHMSWCQKYTSQTENLIQLQKNVVEGAINCTNGTSTLNPFNIQVDAKG